MTCYFYIVRCSDNSLYCGQTNNIKRRIKEHNFDKSRSAKYTKIRRPVKLIFFEEFQTLQEAMKREFQVKKWTKAKKEALIAGSLAARETMAVITPTVHKKSVIFPQK